MATATKAVKKTPAKAPKKAAPKIGAKAGMPLFSKKTMALFAKACKALKHDPAKVLPNVASFPQEHRKSLTAYAMLILIIEYVNKMNNNWKADYHLANPKYWTWHLVKADAKRPTGFGFSCSGCDCAHAYSGVGSRLCFGKKEDEREYASILEELYIAYKL